MYFTKNFKILTIVITLSAFALTNAKSAEECFEKTSRSIFKFNMAFDEAILEPIAKGYNKLPGPIKTGTSNFTSNIGTLLSIPNNLLQGNFKQIGHSVGSFAINTTVGILGFLNPAERLGLKPQKKCGTNFRVLWNRNGMLFCSSNSGSYDCKDSIGMVADTFMDPSLKLL